MSRAATKGKASTKKPKKKAPAKRPSWSNCSSVRQSNSNSDIKVGVATLKDLKAVAACAESRKNQPIKGERRTLLFVPSKLERDKIYREVESILETHEMMALSPHGRRLWKCTVKLSDPPKAKRGPLFRYRKGKLELATLSHLIGKITQQQLEEDQLSQEAADATRYPQVHVSRTWTSPLNVRYSSRKAAMEASLELVRRDYSIQKLLLGLGARGNLLTPKKHTKKQALEVGKYRFERDGVWVIGQEEQWQLNRKNALLANNADIENKHQCTKIQLQGIAKLPLEGHALVEDVSNATDQTYPLVEASQNYGSNNIDSYCNVSRDYKMLKTTVCQDVPTATIIASAVGSESAVHVSPSVGIVKTNKSVPGRDATATATINGEEDGITMEASEQSQQSLTGYFNITNASNGTSNEDHTDSSIPIIPVIAPCEPPRRTKKSNEFRPSNRWRLSEQQINLCYQACMEHYEKVVYTVKARGLHQEFAAGFDVFRERGRGRFDLQLDAFDLPQFSFLSSNDAPWMEAVRTILGNGAILIHKGCFLSLPGSETQKYHQDGVHLNKGIQKPCHAVNVFIPLVDLAMNNGPTEFCLGSHMLGWEGFRRECAETPLPLAGSAVIFDYRLGHRGLGNVSQDFRPVVYLTYTHCGSSFKDQVNFSRKRYRRLGEIAERPVSRDERALRRKTSETNEET